MLQLWEIWHIRGDMAIDRSNQFSITGEPYAVPIKPGHQRAVTATLTSLPLLTRFQRQMWLVTTDPSSAAVSKLLETRAKTYESCLSPAKYIGHSGRHGSGCHLQRLTKASADVPVISSPGPQRLISSLTRATCAEMQAPKPPGLSATLCKR